ncbi:hypothetical protein HMH01_01255 [Halovulum dunhuangense]|uniref:DUF1468 domain-containing protein n=1 Tax=Halovulum dunhuangense TaxID=1505036 RepID=A0A849KPR9_9RHOB|nr:tripartite tricarboxylate transporter TctB family protein [Halovulum dunhuangense]NNU79053.1 hypothetical protein [Halovulum dunhuangense]
MQARLGEMIVPLLVLIGCVLFWWHIQEARSVAQRVPNLVLVFTLALTLLVGVRIFVLGKGGKDGAAIDLKDGTLHKRVAFLGLCLVYYLTFQPLGFTLSNLLFLLLAYRLAGLGWRQTGFAALVSTIVFHGLALLMDFNVPKGVFGI